MRRPTIGELIKEQLGVIQSFNQQIAKTCLLGTKMTDAVLAIQSSVNRLNELSNSKECQIKKY